MTPDRLRTFTRKNLEDLAQRNGIPRRHQMRKEELIDALMAAAPTQRSAARSTPARSKTKPEAEARSEKQSTASKPSKRKEQPRSTATNPSTNPTSQPVAKARLKRQPVNRTLGAHSGAPDHLQLVAINDHWGLATWAVSPALVARAASALGADWHGAQPVLRVLESIEEEGNPTTIHREDLIIQGSEQAWFFRLSGPQAPNLVQLGYVTTRGAFHLLLRSRPLRSKPASTSDGWKTGWDSPTGGSSSQTRPQNAVLTLQPDKLTPFLTGASSDSAPFPLHVRAEVILSGQTLPQSRLRVLGELVELSQDGQFSVRFPLPVGRHILPAVATTPDGMEERTVVFAVEATSRELEVRNCDEFPL